MSMGERKGFGTGIAYGGTQGAGMLLCDVYVIAYLRVKERGRRPLLAWGSSTRYCHTAWW
eukprot:789277-Rhodomonas_salina.2